MILPARSHPASTDPALPAAGAPAAAPSRRDWLAGYGLVVAVLAVATSPIWSGSVEYIWDMVDYYFPAFAYAGEELRRGGLALWDPFTACGQPFHADPQNAVTLNPVALLLTVAVRPAWFAFSLYWVFVWLAGALGAARLARALGAGPPGVAFAGIAWGLSGFYVGHASHLVFLTVASGFPWAAAFAHEAVARRSVRRALAAGAALGATTWGGYPGVLIFAGLLLAVWLLLAFVSGAEDGAPLRERVRWVVGVLAVTGGITLLVWSPSLYAFFREGRGYTDRIGAIPRALAVDNGALSGWAIASVFFSRINIFGVSGLAANITFNDAYFGALAVPLAAAGLARAPRRRWWLLAFAAFALLLSLGSAGLLRGLLYDLLPPTRYTRHTGALRMFWMLALVVAAGVACSRVAGEPAVRRAARWGWGAWAAVAVPVGIAVWWWLGTLGARREATPAALFLHAAVALAASGVVLAASQHLGRLAPWTCALVLAADVGWHLHANHGTVWASGPGPGQQVEALRPADRPAGQRIWITGTMNAQQLLRLPVVKGYVTLSSREFAKLADSRFAQVLSTTRHWIAPGVTPAPSREAALAALSAIGAGDPVPVFVAEGAHTEAGAVVPGSYGAVHLRSYEPNRIRLFVDVPPAGGWLASTERSSTGWTAAIDGVPVEMRTANLMFRAHPVPPGRHEVEWRFDPGLWPWLVRLGWLSFAAAVLVAAGAPWRRSSSGRAA